ncbi:MAG: hypothetical protein DYG89_48535 [Caldilinea sp. CFX5]|nr:hypothetical protein [Caldilinea sp. CFX5]
MAGIEFLSFQGLWLVLAGFILGFAASTLWEWLYYRGKRQAQGGQAAATTAYPAPVDNPRLDHDDAAQDESNPAWAFSYRSPGVYLESEQHATADSVEMGAEPRAKVIVAPPPEPVVTTPARINPATLAALQNAVAQAPVAHPSELSTTAPVATLTAAQKRPDPPLVATTLSGAESRNGTEQSAAPLNGVEAHAPRATSVATPPPTVQSATVTTTADPALDHPDNLAMIRGVGEAYKRRLYGVGIYTWRQMAESDLETLRRVTRAKPNADINAWRTQARELAEKYQRWQTTFRGPLDDFTRIDGIGAITADLLYKAGLCTYEQLAGALPDELAKIVPAPTVGEENDFEGWIAAAVRLANMKRRNEGLLA